MKVGDKHSKRETENMSERIIQLNEKAVKEEIRGLVGKSVEEALNDLLDKEADELTGVGRYERTAARQGYHSGQYTPPRER